MPIPRLRALITLYHDTKGMITRENLSEKIDAVFLDRYSSRAPLADFYRYDQLTEALTEKKKGKNRVSSFRGVTMDLRPVQTWSEQKTDREAQMRAALWGTQSDGKAGLETVLETVEAAEKEEQLFNQTTGSR